MYPNSIQNKSKHTYIIYFLSEYLKKGFSLLLMFCYLVAQGQESMEYSILWERKDFTGSASIFGNISIQKDSTYIVTGKINEKGYLVHFKDNCEIIRDYELPLPDNNSFPQLKGTPQSIIVAAFTMKNGNILAVGQVTNENAEAEYKVMNSFLKNGVWILIIDPESGNIIQSKMDRGMLPYGAVQYSNTQILVYGYDYIYQPDGNRISMFRIYNQDGSIAYDNYDGGLTSAKEFDIREISQITKLKNGDFFADNPGGAKIIDGKTFGMKSGFTTSKLDEYLTPLFPGTSKHNWFVMYPKRDGGAFGHTNFSLNFDTYQRYGMAMFEFNKTDEIKGFKQIQEFDLPTSIYYNNIIPDSRNEDQYIGVVNNNGKQSLFLLKNLSGDEGFQLINGAEVPFNITTLIASPIDGYFAAGYTSENHPAIMKFSFCSALEAVGVRDIFTLYSNKVFINHTINYKGASGDSPNDIKYDLTATVVSGKINGVEAGGILEVQNNRGVISYSGTQPASGKVLNLVKNYQLDPTKDYAEVKYQLKLKNRSCEKEYTFKAQFSKPTQNLFSDDIWLFGTNGTGNKTSRGIRFKVQNETKYAEDYCGVSMVNGRDNILSVNDPCGELLFYVQGINIYNAKHETMSGVSIKGNLGVADGLQSAYIGGNKYILFSVSDYSRRGNLYWYIVDMSAENGLGKVEEKGKVAGDNKINNSIELVPKVGTNNQYWLIFHDVTEGKLKVLEIDGNQSNPIGSVVTSLNFDKKITSYRMKISQQFNKLVLNLGDPGEFYMYSFNPYNGELSLDYSKPHQTLLYGAEFSPNGNYLYTIAYDKDQVHQFDVLSGKLLASLQYNPIATAAPKGGDIKLAPDGKIYIIRWDGQYLAVINNPNLPLEKAGLIMDGFHLSMGGNGYSFSTGITPPWINPPLADKPIALPDGINVFKQIPVSIDPTLNDGGKNLYLAKVDFTNTEDKIKGVLMVKDNLVTFTPKVDFPFTKNENIKLEYTIKNKDNSQLCDNGTIHIILRDTPEIQLQDSCSFAPKLKISNYVEGLSVQWQFSEDNTSWQDIVGVTTNVSAITKEGYYRVEFSKVVNAVKKVVYTNSKHYQVKIETVNGKTWYRISEY